MGMAETALLLDLDRDTGPADTDARVEGTGYRALLSSGILQRLPAISLAANCLEVAGAVATPGAREGLQRDGDGVCLGRQRVGFMCKPQGRVDVVRVLRTKGSVRKKIALKTSG